MTREGPYLRHKWTFRFLIAVGAWNFIGAGIFGFLINLPIVSYFEVATLFTPNHAHTAMMGVFGMLAVALMVFALRETVDERRWRELEKYVACAFFGLNAGLALMVALNLFPGGLLQIRDVLQHGYWHARGVAYTGTPRGCVVTASRGHGVHRSGRAAARGRAGVGPRSPRARQCSNLGRAPPARAARSQAIA